MYSKYPRIDKELIQRYHKGLIATTCCLGALVPQAILKKERKKVRMNLNGGSIFFRMIIRTAAAWYGRAG
jgi:DNA polymerase III alpha subunit